MWETPGRSFKTARATQNDEIMREDQLVTQHGFPKICCAVSAQRRGPESQNVGSVFRLEDVASLKSLNPSRVLSHRHK